MRLPFDRRSSRRVANFFFVLFLFGKEKGHLQTKNPKPKKTV